MHKVPQHQTTCQGFLDNSARTDALADILDLPISFHRVFVTLTGSVTAAVMLSQAVYWTKRMPGGWFWLTRDGWEEQTGLSRSEQESARARLRATGFWQEERKGVPAKLHYRVNLAALRDALNLLEAKPPSSRAEPCQLDGGNPANWTAEILPTISETTTETTAENTEERKDTPLSAKADIPPRGKCDVPSEPCLLTIEPDSDAKGKPNGKYPARFEQFWQAYRALGCTRPHNKAASLKAYQRALTRAEHEVIMDGLERYAVHLDEREAIGHHDARDYVPMPQTWLNQARWDTEYPAQQLRIVSRDPKAPQPGTRRETMQEQYERLRATPRTNHLALTQSPT